jgi:cytochrome P450
MSDTALSYDVLALVHEPSSRDRALEHLRRTDPVHWDERNGWWLCTRHADVRYVSDHPEIFSSEPKGPWHVAEHRFSMQAMDGEPHVRHRSVVSRAFTPRMVSTLAERARRYADEAIDALAGRSGCEFVSELAAPVPMRIIADMLGVADGDLQQFREWGDAMISVTNPQAGDADFARTATMVGELRDYIGRKVAQRRAEPCDDVLSRIVEAGDSGLLHDSTGTIDRDGASAPDDVEDMALFLLLAGSSIPRRRRG